MPFIAGVMLDVAVGIKHGHGLANLWGYLSVDSLSVLWSHGTWNADNVNILGFRFVPSGPYDSPLWFLRDLIVVVVLSPVIYWFIRKRVFSDSVFCLRRTLRRYGYHGQASVLLRSYFFNRCVLLD